jgi:hypothetical protein
MSCITISKRSHIIFYLEEIMSKITLTQHKKYIIATFPNEENFFFIGKIVSEGVATFGEGSYKHMIIGVDCMIDERLTQLWSIPSMRFFNAFKHLQVEKEYLGESLYLSTGLPEILEKYPHKSGGYLSNLQF